MWPHPQGAGHPHGVQHPWPPDQPGPAGLARVCGQLPQKSPQPVAQLHGSEDADYIAALRRAAPGYPAWKAFRIRTPADLQAANASTADLVILDNGYGTGETFDWTLTAGVSRPYLLAQYGTQAPEHVGRYVKQMRDAL